MCTSPEILLRTWNSEETLQECSNVSRDMYKSGVFLLRTCTPEESLQMFSNMFRGVPKSRELYSGHEVLRNHSKSVPVYLEMCRSPETFTPDMNFKEILQEYSSMSRDVHKSGDIWSGHGFRGITL
jgi:hypothetical protein